MSNGLDKHPNNKPTPAQINLRINHKRPKTVMGNKKDRKNAESSFKDPIASDHTLLGSIPKFDREIIKDLPAIAIDPENVSKPLRSAARTHIMSK